jgi:hypothetical protein
MGYAFMRESCYVPRAWEPQLDTDGTDAGENISLAVFEPATGDHQEMATGLFEDEVKLFEFRFAIK